MSENSGNVIEANNTLSTEIHNAVKNNKTNNAKTSDENRKASPKIRETKMIKTKLWQLSLVIL